MNALQEFIPARQPQPAPIYTPYNKGKGRTERRIFRDGRWQKPDEQAASVLGWLRSGNEVRR